MAGVVASSTAFLLLLVLLPKNGSVALAAETCYCYQRSAVNGEANKLTKTIALAVGPIELQIKKTVSPADGMVQGYNMDFSHLLPLFLNTISLFRDCMDGGGGSAPSGGVGCPGRDGDGGHCGSNAPFGSIAGRPSADPVVMCGTPGGGPTATYVFGARFRSVPASHEVGKTWLPVIIAPDCGLGGRWRRLRRRSLLEASSLQVAAAASYPAGVLVEKHARLMGAHTRQASWLGPQVLDVRFGCEVPTGSRETRRERRSRRMPRPQLRETLIIDSNGNSRLDGNSELFYCPMCTTTAPIIHKSSFGSCGHAFCNSCVAKYIAVRQRENVALPVECPECEDDACRDPLLNSDGDGNEDSSADGNDVGDGLRRRAGKRPQHQPPVDMLLLTEGNEDLPVDGVGELFDCAICMETVPGTLKFIINSCGHAFCSSCVAQYVAAKLDDNVCPIECPQPGCEDGTIEPESCHGIIPTDLLDKWGLLLCELAVGAKRIYCPYLECSALLLTDGEAGAAAIAEAECPHCHRLFCARCAVPWHDGFGCEEFQKLGQDERGREDLLLRGLVGREGWQRCPECQMFVEKSEGCNYIKCRCGYSFCYRCASELSAQNHYCNKCKR
uniref:RBR-type E3 ubiquitin transferase n=1 Tax=Aegilops tauschii TaxID=37682 RepID=N1QP62_AEGTA